MANACCWWGSSRQELWERVHVKNMWDSCFQAPLPPPDHSSWKWSTCILQTVLTMLWRTNAFLGTFVILRPRIIHQSPFASLTTHPATVFMVAFNTYLRQSIQTEIHILASPSKMDVTLEKDDNRVHTFFLYFWSFSRAKIEYYPGSISTGGYLCWAHSMCAFLHTRSKMWLHWCINGYGSDRTLRE